MRRANRPLTSHDDQLRKAFISRQACAEGVSAADIEFKLAQGSFYETAGQLRDYLAGAHEMFEILGECAAGEDEANPSTVPMFPAHLRTQGGAPMFPGNLRAKMEPLPEGVVQFQAHPISTAPRNRSIMLFHPGGYWLQGNWLDGAWALPSYERSMPEDMPTHWAELSDMMPTASGKATHLPVEGSTSSVANKKTAAKDRESDQARIRRLEEALKKAVDALSWAAEAISRGQSTTYSANALECVYGAQNAGAEALKEQP